MLKQTSQSEHLFGLTLALDEECHVHDNSKSLDYPPHATSQSCLCSLSL